MRRLLFSTSQRPRRSHACSTDSVYGVKLPGALLVGVIGIIKFYQEL
jgi:hypothetical protein